MNILLASFTEIGSFREDQASAAHLRDSLTSEIRVAIISATFTFTANVPFPSKSKVTTPFQDTFRIVTRLPPPFAARMPNSHNFCIEHFVMLATWFRILGSSQRIPTFSVSDIASHDSQFTDWEYSLQSLITASITACATFRISKPTELIIYLQSAKVCYQQNATSKFFRLYKKTQTG